MTEPPPRKEGIKVLCLFWERATHPSINRWPYLLTNTPSVLALLQVADVDELVDKLKNEAGVI